MVSYLPVDLTTSQGRSLCYANFAAEARGTPTTSSCTR